MSNKEMLDRLNIVASGVKTWTRVVRGAYESLSRELNRRIKIEEALNES